MAQTDVLQGTVRGDAGVWIFRALLVAGAAFMLYSWFQPWWSTDIAVIKGDADMVLHPWGVEAAPQVRTNIDQSAFQMPFPQVFAGFMWVYLVVCMLALAASLFVTRRFRLGPINLSLAMVMILLVGLSYMAGCRTGPGNWPIEGCSVRGRFPWKGDLHGPRFGCQAQDGFGARRSGTGCLSAREGF